MSHVEREDDDDVVDEVVAEVLRSTPSVGALSPISECLQRLSVTAQEGQRDPGESPSAVQSDRVESAQDSAVQGTGSDAGWKSRPLDPAQEQDIRQRIAEESQRIRTWIHCFAVVDFDVEQGQVVEQVFPRDVELSSAQKTALCFMAFPDSHSGVLGDCSLCFCLPPADGATAGLFGFAFSRQQADSGRSRGYFQKSLALLTPLPFAALFDTVVRTIGPLLMEHGPSVLEVACHNMAGWPSPRPGLSAELPLLGSVLLVTLPHRFATGSYAMGIGWDRVLPGMAECGAAAGPGPVAGQGAVAGSASEEDASALVSPRLRARVAVKPPTPSRTMGLVAPTVAARESVVVDGCSWENALPLQELNLYALLGEHLEQLWTLWELVLLNQPLVVVAPGPGLCSRAVLALCSLIAPLPYCGDVRPYFTVHDPDYKLVAQPPAAAPLRTAACPAIVGITNPFFVKALSHWPSWLYVGTGRADGAASPPPGLPRYKPPQLDTPYRALLRSEARTVLQRMLEPREGLDRVETINNLVLRQHFADRTEAFLRPLDMFFASYEARLVRETTAMNPPPAVQFFPEDEFVAFCNGLKGPDAVSRAQLDLYHRFVRCSNFRAWFNPRWAAAVARMRTLYRTALCHMDTDAVARSLSAPLREVTLLDLCLRLQHEMAREQRAARGSSDVLLKLQAHLRALLAVLPPELAAGVMADG